MSNFCKIHKIRDYLSKDACLVLVLGLIMSHIDYANGLLINVPNSSLEPFQRFQNMCAKLVLKKKTSTPVQRMPYTIYTGYLFKTELTLKS